MRKWWDEAHAMSLDNPADRSFVVEDLQNNGKIVAFSRWQVPQQDGNQERGWPEMDPSQFDMEIVGAFFGGMEENRRELMGSRPHWCEYLFVDAVWIAGADIDPTPQSWSFSVPCQSTRSRVWPARRSAGAPIRPTAKISRPIWMPARKDSRSTSRITTFSMARTF